MADLVLQVAKLLVEGALTTARSVIHEETKLRESAQRDLVFITGEFQMMQSFLKATSKEHIKNNTVSTWVTQVRDLAYDVEDGIEFVIHLDTEPTGWRRFFILPCMARPQRLDEAVSNIQLLKARVEDVSHRSARYNLIMDSSAKPQPAASSAASVAVQEMLAEAKDKKRRWEDLIGFLTKEDDNSLQVMSVWARGRELETASIIRKAYDDPTICRKFQCRAWVKLMHPFNPREFIQSLLSQFYYHKEKHGAIIGNDDVLNRIKAVTAAEDHLVEEFARQLNNQAYLIVVDGLSTMFEWDSIKTYLPDRRNGSRIIVSTQHFEIASFCTGNPYLRRVKDDHSPCVFFKMDSEGSIRETGEASERATIRAQKENFRLHGSDLQTKELQECLFKALTGPFSVMSVWGTNGVGKSASVRKLYYKLCDDKPLFKKYGWVDVSHPFDVRDFSQTLFQELSSDSLEATADAMEQCRKILNNHKCLIVIDGLYSKEEWNMIQDALVPGSSQAESIIIVITSEVSIALHCTGTEELVLNIKCLKDDAAFYLLKEEVHRKSHKSTIKDVKHVSDNSELRELISKCGGLPKVIVAAAGLLAKDAANWENIASSMNAQFMHYLEPIQELHDLFGWMHSYFRALPDDVRQSIAYLSLFPGHCTIRRRRLVMRWVAEGYSKDNDSYLAGENGEELFSKLVELSMIQPPQLTDTRLVSYQVSEFFRQYIISRPVEENITIALEIFVLKGHCHPTSQRRGRHLVIEESWHRDRIVFENIDFSRLRSLTVLGKWESFFISRRMKVLRVLDLEDASGVTNKDVEKILELLPRLKFLSLRGCREVTHLPSSLGELGQLQILDVRDTSIVSMPASISKLKKLQYICAGTTDPSTPHTVVSGLAKLFELGQLPGVKLSTGIRKLTLLHTLGVVNVGGARGKTILKELKNLTHLRKLGLSGISKRNSKEFCSAISCHAHLESLSLWLSNSKCDQGCYLDDISYPPENLRSLKIHGLGQELPAWIKGLDKLAKLELDLTISPTYDINEVLGDLKELHTLHLCVNSLQDGGDIKLHFRVELNGAEEACYTKVKVLQIVCMSKLEVTFGEQAMENLELMVVGCCSNSKLQFNDLNRLSPQKLKEVRVLVSSDNTFKSFEALKKDRKALHNDLKAEIFKDMNSQVELKDVRPVRSRNKMLKDLETLKKNMETLQKNLDSQLKLKEVRLLGSRDNTLRDLETLKKDLEMKDLETRPLKMKFDTLKKKLDTLKKKLIELETLEKKLKTLKMENIEELRTDFDKQLGDHPKSPAVILEY